MRTLKKTLCLVLALVLCLGLASVAFAGNFDGYTDADKIGAQYEEAVAVLMGTGIVNGMTATEIAPEGNFTREQAAKIVTYMTLGGTLADVLKADADPFEDVKANRWSAGYVAYCVDKGIIAGYGDGKFGPTDTLTGYQFAKMLLVAIGYGESSDYEGKSWSINVAKDAFSAGIFEGDAAAATNEPVQRQQAMLMAFNALNYSKTGTTSVYVVKLGDKVLYTGSDALTALVMQQANEGATLALETVSTGSLGDTVFGLKKSTSTDAFGRESKTYINKNNTKQVYATLAPTAVLTVVGSITEGKLAAALGCTKTTDKVSITLIEDGEESDAENITKLDTDVIGDVGTTIEVYKTGESTYDVIVIYTYMYKLAKEDVVAAKKATATTDADVAYVLLDSKRFDTNAFKAGDVVLYTEAKIGEEYVVQSAVKATAVTGVISKYTADTITVGGTTYKIDDYYFNKMPESPFTTEYVFYVDSNNVAYTYDDVSAAEVKYDGYFYVLGYQIAMNGKAGDLFNDAVATTAAVKAKVVTTAGEEKVIDLAVTTKTVAGKTHFYYNDVTGKEVEITESKGYTEVTPAWVAYTVSGAAYNVEAAADTLTVGKDGYNKATTLEGKLMTSSTVYTYINTADKKVATSTGYQNIKIAAGSKLLVIYADAKKTVVKELYLVKATTDISGTTANYAYAAAQGATVADGVEWTFYIDGEVKVLPVAKGVSIAAGKVYDLTISTKNVVTAASAGITLTGVEVTFVDSTYFVAGSVYTYATTGCKVYNVTTGTPGTADTIEVGDKVAVAVAKDGAASLVYIVG